MQCLPTLAADYRRFDLPLSPRTAHELIAALMASSDEDRHPNAAGLLATLLNVDAAFALWTLCRALDRGHAQLNTVESLAGWLAGSMRRELSWPAAPDARQPIDSVDSGDSGRPDPRRKMWADLAARSYGIARLSELVARHKSLDEDRAYLLGLVHEAPQWLAAASADRPPPSASADDARRSRGGEEEKDFPAAGFAGLLPDWLAAGLGQIAASPGNDPASPAACVAAALRIASGKRGPIPRWPGFKFNRRAHAADMAAIRRQWLAESTAAHVLPLLSARLARLDQLEDEFQRALETEKLDALKELAYGAGHEINNPLANISARAQTLLQQERDPERRRMLAAINTQAFRAHEMIADMMLFARPPQPQPSDVDLVEVLRIVADELAPQAAAQASKLDFHPADSVLIARVDKTQIAVAVRALCTNALEALVKGGRVELAIARSSRDDGQPAKSRAPGETVQITVSDDGPGIAPKVRRHIFDPFYSGREAGRGLGFGLSKCWRIVGMHGGRIDVEGANGRGARFTITLPIAQ
jgi:signal transduction histidine kinase